MRLLRRFIIVTICLSGVLCAFAQSAKQYNVQDFGAVADGKFMNTRTIQYAIDYVSAHGGGELLFTPGRYLCGSIYLKSNVTLNLQLGATLLGSTNPLDYVKDPRMKWTAFVMAVDQENIGVIGEGTITCQGFTTAYNLVDLVNRGAFADGMKYDRPTEASRPSNIYFRECTGVTVTGITLRDPASWNQIYDQCKNVYVDHVKVYATSYWNNDGIDIVDCDGVKITNCFFDAADDVICFKSHSKEHMCQNIVVDNCTGRSSANGVKFGTASCGGFKNVKLTNITIYDTYRSAVTLAAVDGAEVDGFEIDGLRSINTGNVIYLRTGHRRNLEKQSSMKNIVIRNVYAEVPADKPDAGYMYEGPVEDLPRNISPSGIVGQPDIPIENVLLANIEIVTPGGGTSFYAYQGTAPDELEAIPEQPAKYPEFSQFKELPAWGFYVRHANNLVMRNVNIKALQSDYRPAIVMDDVNGASLQLKIEEPASSGKQQVITNKVSNCSVDVTK